MGLDNEVVIELVDRHFGLKGTLKPLMGEEDYNYLLSTNDSERYLVKISRPNSSQESIDFQLAVLQHLHESDFQYDIPLSITSKEGHPYVRIDNSQIIRIQSWVEGRLLVDINPRSKELLSDWGKICGGLSSALQSFEHPAAHRFYKWNPSETLHSKKYFDYFVDEEQKEIASYFWDLFEKTVVPKLKDLRKSINYNDAHERNILCSSNLKSSKISGLIDFGDALHCETINELAIACAYAGMDQKDPIQAMQFVVQGYHDQFPIQERELEVLFPLIAARLMITVSSAAWNKHQEPDNEYLVISERPAWELLQKLRQIAPALAHYQFRAACNLEPCIANGQFKKWINENSPQCSPIIDFTNKKIIPLDLSVGSLSLGAQKNFEDIKYFERCIDDLLAESSADYGIGGYLEPRPLYTTDEYVVEGNQGRQWRTVHLGVDVWGKAGTPIYAPLNAVVAAIQNNDGDRDYGPTLILKHIISDDFAFYTLYGHLGMEVLKEKKVGDLIQAGTQIATIGSSPTNGNWPSHLHFQVLLDTLDYSGDFPGAVFPNEVETWQSICPDPMGAEGNLFFPNIKKENNTATNILHKRKESLGASLSLSYDRPLHIVRGYKQWLYDVNGRKFLDTVNNVPHVGHQHPRVVAAAQRQLSVLNTNTRYLHDNITNYAEQLLFTFPDELCVVHIVNSGSEANELAMRMVEAYTGQNEMIAVEAGYHGNTQRTIDVSSYKFDGKGGKGKPMNTQLLPLPDSYNGIYTDGLDLGEKYAAHVEDSLRFIDQNGKQVGGFIGESILSCGGQIVLPEGYLSKVYEKVRAAGGICIADEVQVGFGRSGDKFWAFELQNVIPDIVTLGKPIANGHPMGAVVCTRKVADAFANGMEYFNTFGGNPVSCAIGAEVLSIIKDEELQRNAREIGSYLKNELNLLKKEFSIIGDVRGKGLFLGIELVTDPVTKVAATKEAKYLKNRMRERGILMSTDGPRNNVLKIKPPMCFTQLNADYLIKNLKVILKEDFLNIGKEV